MESISGKQTEISFISTYSNNHDGGIASESLGAEVLAGDLMGEFKDEVSVNHYDLQIDNYQKIKQNLIKDQPDILGISVKIGGLDQLKDTMKIANELPYSPKIVLGGVVPTFATKEILELYPNTIIAIGEGEIAMRGLVEFVKSKRELLTIPGIATINDGSIVRTDSERINLANHHYPARLTTERINGDQKNGILWFEGSRGCDGHCTFCSRRELRGDGFSGNLTASHVAEDLSRLSKMGVNYANATDDDWLGDPERSLSIAEEIINRDINIKWSISTRVDHIWQEPKAGDNPATIATHNARLKYILEKQVQAGLDRVFIGVESFSPTQLKRFGKHVNVCSNYKAIDILRSLNIDVVAGYIPIDPLMTIHELKENFVGLRNTGMYKKVNPLSSLRVQAGSPYLNMIKKREQSDSIKYLSEKSKELVFYDIINYSDKRVQIVADIADEWEKSIHPLIYSLKMNLFSIDKDEKTNNEQMIISENIISNIRELEMNFIESVTDSLIIDSKNQSELNRIFGIFEKQRIQLTDQAQRWIDGLNIKIAL